MSNDNNGDRDASINRRSILQGIGSTTLAGVAVSSEVLAAGSSEETEEEALSEIFEAANRLVDEGVLTEREAFIEATEAILMLPETESTARSIQAEMEQIGADSVRGLFDNSKTPSIRLKDFQETPESDSENSWVKDVPQNMVVKDLSTTRLNHCERKSRVTFYTWDDCTTYEPGNGTANCYAEGNMSGWNCNADTYAQFYGAATAEAWSGSEYDPAFDGDIQFGSKCKISGNNTPGAAQAELIMAIHDTSFNEIVCRETVDAWGPGEQVNKTQEYWSNTCHVESEHDYIVWFQLHSSASAQGATASSSDFREGLDIIDNNITIINWGPC